MDLSHFPVNLVFGCALVAPLIVIPVLFILSKKAGWLALAEKYRAPNGSLPGTTYSMRSGQIGYTRYRGLLVVTFQDDALVLGVIGPFSVGHPTLRIPYAEMQVKPCRSWLMRGYRFTTQQAPAINLSLWAAPDHPFAAEILQRFPDARG